MGEASHEYRLDSGVGRSKTWDEIVEHQDVIPVLLAQLEFDVEIPAEHEAGQEVESAGRWEARMTWTDERPHA